MLQIVRVAALAAAICLLASEARAADGCGAIPQAHQPKSGARPLEPEDLVRLRDIGSSYTVPSDAQAFSVSPDGKRIAFQIRQADPTTNGFCFAMLVMETKPGSVPIVIDSGGEYIRWSYDFRGKAGFPSGLPVTVSPRWSPDGRWIVFLKRMGGVTQLWRAEADGTGSAALTASPVDITDVRISADGKQLLFAAASGLADARERIWQESRSGYRFDNRYSPMTSSKPFAAAPAAVKIYAIPVAGGEPVEASDVLARAFSGNAKARPDAIDTTISAHGRAAWVIPPHGDEFFWNSRLAAADGEGRTRLCRATLCSSWVSRPWWTDDGRRVRFFRREGWAQSSTAIYEWTPSSDRLRKLYRTDDLLTGCEPWEDRLVCLRETSTKPRRLEILDLADGTTQLLFDPNPEFAALSLGAVERLHWRNDFGVESYADFVLPTDYQPGRKYPLIIVQYETRGFLRGGTGDEYPIQAFANRGYAVLSFARPRDIGYFRAHGESGVALEDTKDFADRKSVQSSLMGAIKILTGRGVIDPARIGITGLSDGAATVLFGLANSPVFAAAAVSNCCFDPSTLVLTGPVTIRAFTEEGYPFPTERDDGFWRSISLALNASRTSPPLLMQLSDDEYLTALESFTALRHAGAAVDLYIFPDEHHIKWQPSHRLAIYQRNIAWFDFWLKGIRSSDGAMAQDVTRWEQLRSGGD